MESSAVGHMSVPTPQLIASDNNPVLLITQHQITAFNDAAGRLFNARKEQLATIRHPAQLSPLQQPCGTDSYHKADQMLVQAIQQGKNQFYWLHQKLSGETFYARVTLTAVTDTNPTTICAQVQDLSNETRNRLDAALGRLMFDKSHDAVMITDHLNRIVAVNPAFSRITGYPSAEALGLPAGFMRSGVHDQNFYLQLWQMLRKTGVWEGEIWDKHRQGHLFLKDLKICSVPGPDGHVMNYLALFSDASAQTNHKIALEKLAYYDSLTGLPNRALLLETLERTITKLNLQSNEPLLALAFIDIDNFKAINDTRGHLFGDQLIKAVTQRISGLMLDGDFLGRMSGDEFLLIFSPQQQIAEIEQQVSSIIEALREPFQLDDINQLVNLSIGISLYPKDGTDSTNLIAKADIAMYHAKNSGGSHFRFYSAEVGARFFETSDIELHLVEAIRKGGIYPKFQPKIDLHTGAVVGAEILARWQRDNGDFVSPDKFIAVAEQQYLIRSLSDSLLRQCGALVSPLPAALNLTLAFNVSVQELLRPQFSQQFIAMLSECGLDPDGCEIEITESCLIENFALAKNSIDELRAQGVKVAIDDFGTGFCSLNYLRSLAVDTIKLDRSFVGELDENNLNNIIVVKAIIDLAHQLGIKVLAEGIETITQLAIVKALNCDEAQGFYFSQPAHWPDFLNFARRYNPGEFSRLHQLPLPHHIAGLFRQNPK